MHGHFVKLINELQKLSDMLQNQYSILKFKFHISGVLGFWGFGVLGACHLLHADFAHVQDAGLWHAFDGLAVRVRHPPVVFVHLGA